MMRTTRLKPSLFIAALGVGLLLALVGIVAAARWRCEPVHLRPAPIPAGHSHGAYFTEATFEMGLDFMHDAGPVGDYFFPQIMGAGCALLDVDQDGDLDLFFVNSAARPANFKPQPGRAATHRLYLQDGAGQFRDATAGSGLETSDTGMGVAAGDVNNDGFPDLYVSNYGPDRLFLNRGDATFRDVTLAAGIDNPLWGASCSFLDYDRDGWLDLVVVNYVAYDVDHACITPRGDQDYCHPQNFSGTPAKLYHNETGAVQVASGRRDRVRFRDVSLPAGIASLRGPGLGVVCADFSGDGWPDIFVANDSAPNFLWVNQRDGTFRDEAVQRGVATDAQGRAQANMGIALGDLNADGRGDLFVTHLSGEANALYLSHGRGSFEEAAALKGLADAGFPYTGFGTALIDLDHDGDLDLAVVNGRVLRSRPAMNAGANRRAPPDFWTPYAEPNQLFLNDGSGRFDEASSPLEPLTNRREIGRGLSAGDIDNDGDVDLLVTYTAGPARLFRNEAPKRGHWLLVRVVDPAHGGRDDCGAVVTLTAGGRTWRRWLNPGGSYLSSGDPRVHFGLGPAAAFDSLTIAWADSRIEEFPGGDVDRLITLTRGRGHAP